MIEFALGLLTGLIIALLVMVTLMFFRKVIEQKLQIVEKQVALKGPRPRGSIIMPDSHADEVRDEIIRNNRERGLDTPIDQLR